MTEIRYDDIMKMIAEITDRVHANHEIIPADEPKRLLVGFYDQTDDTQLTIGIFDMKKSTSALDEEQRKAIYNSLQTHEGKLALFGLKQSEVSMKETLDQKIERVQKFGMNDVEIFDTPEEEVRVLMAHIYHLENNLIVAKEGLEEIKTIADLGASGNDCGECAEIALTNSTLRNWKQRLPTTITTIEVADDEEIVSM